MTYDLDRRPPCWPPDTPCPNTCAQAHADAVLRNHLELHGPWAGWRLAGRDLVSPDGLRLPERRLRGLLWREEAELRRATAKARNAKRHHAGSVTVVRIAVRDWHEVRYGRAG